MDTDDLPGRLELRLRGALLGGALILVLGVAGSRWHSAAVAAPLPLASLEGPTVVLVVQEGDCPDRRAALEAWLHFARAAWAEGLPLRVAWLGDGPTRPPPYLEGLATLTGSDAARAEQALVRLGAPGTPALLLVDDRGFPLVGETFAERGVGPRLQLVFSMLEPLAKADSAEDAPLPMFTDVGGSVIETTDEREDDGWMR